MYIAQAKSPSSIDTKKELDFLPVPFTCIFYERL